MNTTDTVRIGSSSTGLVHRANEFVGGGAAAACSTNGNLRRTSLRNTTGATYADLADLKLCTKCFPAVWLEAHKPAAPAEVKAAAKRVAKVATVEEAAEAKRTAAKKATAKKRAAKAAPAAEAPVKPKVIRDYSNVYKATRKNRATGTMVTVATAADLGIDADLKWAVVCEDHGTHIACPTRNTAIATSPLDFCDECRKAAK